MFTLYVLSGTLALGQVIRQIGSDLTTGAEPCLSLRSSAELVNRTGDRYCSDAAP